jgi:hypothetical protein
VVGRTIHPQAPVGRLAVPPIVIVSLFGYLSLIHHSGFVIHPFIHPLEIPGLGEGFEAAVVGFFHVGRETAAG